MDIRKADSKGRMTGFNPGAYYKILRDSRYRFEASLIATLKSEDIYRNPSEDGTPAEAAQDYLNRFGIDPLTVSTENLMEEGYSSFELDEEGKRVNAYGISKIERKPWPEGFNWNEFVGLLVE